MSAIAWPFTIVWGDEHDVVDLDCGGAVGWDGVEAFVLALIDPDGYGAVYPECDLNLADMDRDCRLDGMHVRLFVNALLGP